jgi:hypothetical protein
MNISGVIMDIDPTRMNTPLNNVAHRSCDQKKDDLSQKTAKKGI